MNHKVWGAERLGALNEVLGAELQPEELLLEAPWKEVSDEESSDGEMVVASSLHPGGLHHKPNRTKKCS